jgi:hypothetical protein
MVHVAILGNLIWGKMKVRLIFLIPPHIVLRQFKNSSQANIFLFRALYYTGCRKINIFQVGDLVGKNLRNLEKIKYKI